MGEIYEVSAEMDVGTRIYIPNFIKICSGIQKLMGVGQHGAVISLLCSK
jgi:hypothetical protein